MLKLLFTIVTSLLVTQTESTEIAGQTATCDKGWTHFNEWCYIVNDEYETFSDADGTCTLLGGEIAFAKEDQDLRFLTTLMSKHTHFGYWYGAKSYRYGLHIVYVKDLNKDFYTKSSNRFGHNIKMPKDRVFSVPVNARCVGIHSGLNNYYNNDPFVLPLSCDIKVPYICQGDLIGQAPNNNDPHYFNDTNQNLFWISSFSDRRSYAEASTACQEKSMFLASIKDSETLYLLRDKMTDLAGHVSVDPFWIGLQVENGMLSWTSGESITDKSIINWDPLKKLTNWNSEKVILHDGSISNIPKKAVGPFICMRPLSTSGEFGCPPGWARAGQSCYRKPSNRLYTQVNAKHLCSKIGAHLISLETSLEMQWLQESIMASNYLSIWTSLNDLETKGDFVWADGTKPKTALRWKPLGVIDINSGIRQDCIGLRAFDKDLLIQRCSFRQFPGCQYQPSGDRCVTKDWVYYKGRCYFIPKQKNNLYRLNSARDMVLQTCYSQIANNLSITLQPVKVDDPVIMEMYANLTYYTIWVGMKFVQDHFEYMDGSSVNMSLFKSHKQPDPGTAERPYQCVSIDRRGYMETKSCTYAGYAATALCEKEVPYHPNGKGTSLALPFLTILSSALLSLINNV